MDSAKASTNQPPTRPRGPEQVRAAVLAATRELLVERGFEGFSVRDIAAAADVNHALVHRYFGTKADVLEAVLNEEANKLVAAFTAAPEPATRPPRTRDSAAGTRDSAAGTLKSAKVLAVLEEQPLFWRALAHAVLSAPESAVPGTARTTEFFGSLWRNAPQERAAEASAAGATVLGWLIFGSFMGDVTGADPADVRRLVAEQVDRLTL